MNQQSPDAEASVLDPTQERAQNRTGIDTMQTQGSASFQTEYSSTIQCNSGGSVLFSHFNTYTFLFSYRFEASDVLHPKNRKTDQASSFERYAFLNGSGGARSSRVATNRSTTP